MNWGSFGNKRVIKTFGNLALWGIYSLTIKSDVREFGASTFIYGIPYFVDLIEKNFTNEEVNLDIKQCFYTFSLGLGLLSSFMMLAGKIPLCHFGVGILYKEIPQECMAYIFLALIVPKSFFNIY